MRKEEVRREYSELIRLSLVPGLGAVRIRRLVSTFGSAVAVGEAPVFRLARVEGIGMKTAAAIASFDGRVDVDRQIALALRSGAKPTSLWDNTYPELLKRIFDPPVLLWVKGVLPANEDTSISIVGTRRASDTGRRIARRFAGDLSNRGITVVSGLASGIDTEAHQGALTAGGRTIAVLGSGVDRIYPYANTRLASQVTENGAIVSEYPLGTAPDAVNFPKRNRIISGMCVGTLIVEAHREGGALITARLALEQNREVFAVPGTIMNPAVAGCHELVQQGHAKLVTCVDEILSELPNPVPAVEREHDRNREVIARLPEVEQRLLQELGDEPVQIDVLCERASLDVSTALVHLLTLEFKGLVRQLAGKQFYRERGRW